jgi:hypothetical protein
MVSLRPRLSTVSIMPGMDSCGDGGGGKGWEARGSGKSEGRKRRLGLSSAAAAPPLRRVPCGAAAARAGRRRRGGRRAGLTAAPERTESSRVLSGSANFLPISFSTRASDALTSSIRPGGRSPPGGWRGKGGAGEGRRWAGGVCGLGRREAGARARARAGQRGRPGEGAPWRRRRAGGLTDAVELLAHVGRDGEARGDVDTEARHLTQVGALAAELRGAGGS